MEGDNMEELLNRITVDNIKKQIEDGWDSSFFIAKYIVGTIVWECLSEWDRKRLASRVNRIVRENKLL